MSATGHAAPSAQNLRCSQRGRHAESLLRAMISVLESLVGSPPFLPARRPPAPPPVQACSLVAWAALTSHPSGFKGAAPHELAMLHRALVLMRADHRSATVGLPPGLEAACAGAYAAVKSAERPSLFQQYLYCAVREACRGHAVFLELPVADGCLSSLDVAVPSLRLVVEAGGWVGGWVGGRAIHVAAVVLATPSCCALLPAPGSCAPSCWRLQACWRLPLRLEWAGCPPPCLPHPFLTPPLSHAPPRVPHPCLVPHPSPRHPCPCRRAQPLHPQHPRTPGAHPGAPAGASQLGLAGAVGELP